MEMEASDMAEENAGDKRRRKQMIRCGDSLMGTAEGKIGICKMKQRYTRK